MLDSQSVPVNMSLLSAILIQGQTLIYVIVSFLLLDIGYVIVAKKYTFSSLQDKLALFGSEVFLGICYFLPYFAVVSNKFTSITRFVFVGVLFVISARIVLGMLYGKAVQK